MLIFFQRFDAIVTPPVVLTAMTGIQTGISDMGGGSANKDVEHRSL